MTNLTEPDVEEAALGWMSGVVWGYRGRSIPTLCRI